MRVLSLFLYYSIGVALPDLAFPFGRVFNQVRCALLRRILLRFGNGNEIDGAIYIGDGKDISIGNHCQINRGCRLGNVTIGNYVMVGPEVFFIHQLHRTDSIETPMILQGKIMLPPVFIEDDVWIGARVIVMPSVRIGKGSIVGAGAVVTDDILPYSVVAGVPARITKHREA